MDKAKLSAGVFLILLGLGAAWFAAYRQPNTAFLGVVLAAVGGRLLGESYSKKK